MQVSMSKVCVLAFSLALMAVGCGDDDEAAAGTGGTAGTAGSGGTAGTAGTSGTGGTAGTSMTCGSVTCEPFPEPPTAGASGGLLGGALPIDVSPTHCCTASGGCGVGNATLLNATACIERDSVGEPNTECPDEMLGSGAFGFPLTGCCRYDGSCGLDITIMGMGLGVGCAERAALASGLAGSLASGFLGGDPTWSSVACTYVGGGMDGGTDQDAGL